MAFVGDFDGISWELLLMVGNLMAFRGDLRHLNGTECIEIIAGAPRKKWTFIGIYS